FEASLVKLQPGLVAAQAQALNFAGPPVKVADKTAISLGMIGRPVHNEPEFLQLPLNFVGRVEIDLMNCQAGMACYAVRSHPRAIFPLQSVDAADDLVQ